MGIPWKLVWKLRGLPWKLVRIFGSHNDLSPISFVRGLFMRCVPMNEYIRTTDLSPISFVRGTDEVHEYSWELCLWINTYALLIQVRSPSSVARTKLMSCVPMNLMNIHEMYAYEWIHKHCLRISWIGSSGYVGRSAYMGRSGYVGRSACVCIRRDAAYSWDASLWMNAWALLQHMCTISIHMHHINT